VKQIEYNLNLAELYSSHNGRPPTDRFYNFSNREVATAAAAAGRRLPKHASCYERRKVPSATFITNRRYTSSISD